MALEQKLSGKNNPPFISQQEKGGRKNDNIIFIICIIISFVFWGLIKLADTYNVSYTFNVDYKNVPAEKRLTSMLDSTVNVNFDASGFMIMRLNLFKDLSQLTIDLDECDMLKEGNEYFVYTNDLKQNIAEVIGILETDVSFSESMLGFMLENLHQKKIKVKASLSLNFSDQYDVYEPEIVTPSTVTVYGPKTTIDTLNEVLTQNLVLQNLDKDQMFNVGLNNPIPSLLRFDPEEVEIHIRIEKFTESSIEIPIDFSNINKNIQTFPSSVKVYFKVAQKDFNNIPAGEFTVKPITGGIDLTKVDQLHLVLSKKPSFIRNERLVPNYVEFLINK